MRSIRHTPGRSRRGVFHLALRLSLLNAVLGACSALRSADPIEESLSATGPTGTSCVAEEVPAALPAVDILVDSALVARQVGEILADVPGTEGHVLLTLAFSADGANVRRDVLEYSTSALVADSVQRIVFAARRTAESTPEEWGVRLRIELGSPIRMQVGRREYCPPVARDPQMQRLMEEVSPPPVTFRGGRRMRTIHMRAHVSARGVITGARVVRGELPGSELERELDRYLRQFLFNPATIDGQPADAWVDIPVRVRS